MKQLSNSHREILEKLKDDYFRDYPVWVEEKVEGQSLTAEGDYVLGCRLGPSVVIDSLLHEMCHLAEREVDKLLRRPRRGFWGYYFGPQIHLLGQTFFEPTHCWGVHREARVWAYEINLRRSLNLECPIEDILSAAVYIQDFWLYHRGKTEQEKLAILYDEVTGQLDDFSIANFNREWFLRMELLRQEKEQYHEKESQQNHPEGTPRKTECPTR